MDFLGCLQYPDPGLGVADGKVGLGRMTTLSDGKAQSGKEDHDQRHPQRRPATDGGEDPRDKHGHGVFPDRWSSIRAARVRRA